MKCKRFLYNSLGLLLFFWYILEGIGLFLFAWGLHPAIQISGINATHNEQSRFITYLFWSMICWVIAIVITVLFCDPPKGEVKSIHKNGDAENEM